MNITLAFLDVLAGGDPDMGQRFGGIVALELPRAIDGHGAPFAYPILIFALLKLLLLGYLANHGTIIDELHTFRRSSSGWMHALAMPEEGASSEEEFKMEAASDASASSSSLGGALLMILVL